MEAKMLALAATALWYAEESYKELEAEDEVAWRKNMLDKVMYMSGVMFGPEDQEAVEAEYQRLFQTTKPKVTCAKN
mgnify:CR=1 FL=1